MLIKYYVHLNGFTINIFNVIYKHYLIKLLDKFKIIEKIKLFKI